MGFSCGSDDYDCWLTGQRECHAAKPHKCVECDDPIAKGDPILVVSYYDGEERRGGALVLCERCGDLLSAYLDLGYCYPFGGLWDAHFDTLEMTGKAGTPAWNLARGITERRNARSWLGWAQDSDEAPPSLFEQLKAEMERGCRILAAGDPVHANEIFVAVQERAYAAQQASRRQGAAP